MILLSFISLLKEIDNKLLLFINGAHSDFTDAMMCGISNKYTWIPLCLLILWLVWLLIVYAVLNSYSRVYLGVHYPSDVAVGAMAGITIGVICFLLVFQIVLRLNRKNFSESNS